MSPTPSSSSATSPADLTQADVQAQAAETDAYLHRRDIIERRRLWQQLTLLNRRSEESLRRRLGPRWNRICEEWLRRDRERRM